jgi:hypothetical protein
MDGKRSKYRREVVEILLPLNSNNSHYTKLIRLDYTITREREHPLQNTKAPSGTKEDVKMTTINEVQVQSKVLVFEPGNATRYYLTLTQTSEYNMVMVDMNNHTVVEFSPKFMNPEHLSLVLQSKGYSIGDAKPMAERLVKAVKETAYITYAYQEKWSGERTKTVWFEDNLFDWEDQEVSIGESGGVIYDKGSLDWVINE